ncbi:MAG: dTDP-4-amino-4,6-dideoxygalactose transaminase [Bacteroidetes bacterium]|nr:dTDP-4-amino-4,6-dideoxygalactose transaminase [Bacteroidota bacterium]
MHILFNEPHYTLAGMFATFSAARAGTLSGNGKYTKICQQFFETKYGFRRSLLTSSCTDALEMAAILTEIQPGDEVILPSFTFMSTANAFLLRNAKVVFADTLEGIPNIDPAQIESLVNSRTKAIAVVHYSGIACDMDKVMEIARKHNLLVIEDAAHSLDSYYKGKPLGSIGHFGTFSFHETKNIFCGEGGMLSINDERFMKRAEIIWEKGTNRAAFYRGEIDKYSWVDIGSSFLLSDANAAFLYTQIEQLEKIQKRRTGHWHSYSRQLKPLEEKGYLKLPVIPPFATVNGNMYYIVTASLKERDGLISFLKKNGILAVFHYMPLHSSVYYKDKHDGRELSNTQKFSDCIVRLPFYYHLRSRQIRYIVEKIRQFYL